MRDIKYFDMTFTNFHNWGSRQFETLAQAVDAGKVNGFEFIVYGISEDQDGREYQTKAYEWFPIGGGLYYNGYSDVD